MKKFIYLLSICFLYSCTSSPDKPAPSEKKAGPTERKVATEPLSLNGIPKNEASAMVAEFQKDSSSSAKQTSIWFHKDYFSLLDAAKKEVSNADGVRIYFAKKNGQNALVMVLTSRGGQSSQNSTYFIHDDQFLKSIPILRNDQFRSHYQAVEGADLYYPLKPCLDNNCDANEHFVNCSTARKWTENFTASQQDDTREKINKKSIWYPLSVFNNIRTEIKKKAKGDGFRIYYTKNSSNNYGFILVPTYAHGKFHKDDYKCYINKDNFSPHDRGEECTPFCDGVTLPLPEPDPEP